MSIRAVAAWLLCCLGLTACSVDDTPISPESPGSAPRDFGIEVIVRTPENFRTAADVAVFVDQAAQNGVTAINLLVKQDEDDAIPSGEVYYRSAIAPIAAGYSAFDVLRTTLDAAHARGIKVRAWIPQFHDQVAVQRNSAWQMRAANAGHAVPYTGSRHREYFVNPLDPDVQAYELSIIREVADKYPVDGIMLDWIRFDDYNMDLGDATRRQYRSLQHADPLTIDFSRGGAARDAWNDFRTDGLAAYVRLVRKNLAAPRYLGVYILPPEFVEVGQDAAKFSQDVNAIAPMCYFVDWGYAIDWVWSSCLATTARKSGSAQIVPAMDSDLTDSQYRQIFSHIRQGFPQIRTLAWFHHGQWSDHMLQRIARLSAGQT